MIKQKKIILYLLPVVGAVVAVAIILFRPISYEIKEPIDKLEVNDHGLYEITNEEEIYHLVQLVNGATFRKQMITQREAPNDLSAVVLLLQEDSLVASVVISGVPGNEKVYVLDEEGAYVAYNGEKIASHVEGMIGK